MQRNNKLNLEHKDRYKISYMPKLFEKSKPKDKKGKEMKCKKCKRYIAEHKKVLKIINTVGGQKRVYLYQCPTQTESYCEFEFDKMPNEL